MRNISLFLATLMAYAISTQSAVQNPAPALPERMAVILAVHGKLEASTDGKKFKTMRQGDVLREGAIVRVKGNGNADVFFRRIGTMVRILPRSELKIETLSSHLNAENKVVKDTVLNLNQGRIFAFVRVLFPESKFQVHTQAGMATLQGAGTGRYDISADGRFVAGKASRSSLYVIVDGETRSIDPGNVFNAKQKKAEPLKPSDAEMLLLELDELQRTAELLTPEEAANER